MFKIPEQIKKIAEKYKLSLPKDQNDKTKSIWCVGQSFILKHDAVIRIANHEGVEFFEPKVEILKDEGRCYGVAMWGKGRLVRIAEGGEDYTKEVWTTADATRDNVKGKGGYFFNICEKRWQDRLTLKLLDLYEYGLYSDIEADDFKKESPTKNYNMASDYMKNNMRQIFNAKGVYNKDKAESIFRSLTKEDGQRIKDIMEGGRIDEAVTEFYKLGDSNEG